MVVLRVMMLTMIRRSFSQLRLPQAMLAPSGPPRPSWAPRAKRDYQRTPPKSRANTSTRDTEPKTLQQVKEWIRDPTLRDVQAENNMTVDLTHALIRLFKNYADSTLCLTIWLRFALKLENMPKSLA